MKKQTLFLSVLLVIGTVISMGCMDREPAPVCPVPTELKASDPGLGGFEGVDILVVVDNSGSMAQEQEILATAFFPLINSLLNPTPGWEFDPADDVRIAITTTDMGVSYDGKSYDQEFEPDVKCVGLGDNGAFVSEYLPDATSVKILEGIIPCGEDATQCPTDWRCDMSAGNDIGTCIDPNGNNALQRCPASPASLNLNYVDETWGKATAAFTTACLAQVGTMGCAFEQQLAAGAAGLVSDPTFIRKKSLTALMIVSDEEDCSLQSSEWHNVSELGTVKTNIACGMHKDLLTKVEDIKKKYDDAKEAVSGSSKGMLFAAIIGVPPVSACQGPGTGLSGCLDVKLDEGGTVQKPKIVERLDPNQNLASYYEYACQRPGLVEDEDGTMIDGYVTQAYPGTRFLEMAQLYEDMSYVYSICNENWSDAMVDIAALIAKNLGGTCYGKRLSWNPKDEKADCNVVFDYKTPKSEASSAPPCPKLPDGHKWVKESEVTEDVVKVGGKNIAYWVRSCTVPKIAAPLNCEDFDGAAAAEDNDFGWYYCENPGENNKFACGDGLDNDLDGLVDEKDDSCTPCLTGENGCQNTCPYKVTLTGAALSEAANANDANVVCLQQYRFADPNCKESTFDSCNDGEDNDGNGPFDCNSYGKGESIPRQHFPDEGARKADPDCCPMARNPDGGACQFLNSRGQPAVAEKAAWADNCDVSPNPNSMPDSCCEAATALFCQLPGEFADACEGR